MCKIDWNHGVVHLKNFEDNRGKLCPVDLLDLPFIPKRIFFTCDVPTGVVRGQHAHFTTKQILICSSGKLQIMLYDGLTDVKTYELSFSDAIYVPKLIWNEITFKEYNSVLLSLVSTIYEESDYIRGLKYFETIIRGIKRIV